MSQDRFSSPDNSQSLFGSSSPSSGISVDTAGREAYGNGSTSAASSQNLTPSTSQPDPPTLLCDRCDKAFKTNVSLKRHNLLHVQKDSFARVNAEEVLAAASLLVEEVLMIMLGEPAVGQFGTEKQLYVQQILDNTSDLKWIEFVKYIVDKIFPFLTERSELLPQRQYEHSLKSLNRLLGSHFERSYMSNCLKGLIVVQDQSIISNFVYRFCTLLFKHLQAEVLKMMQTPKDKSASHSIPEMTMDEKQTLYYSCGSIIKGCLVKLRTCSKESVWVARCKCIQEAFIFKDEDDYSLSFLQIKMWFDQRNRGALIALNEDLYNFFLKLEKLIRLMQVRFPSKDLNTETVLAEAVKIHNNDWLSAWYLLTCLHIKQKDSLPFLEELVDRYVKFSMTAHANRMKRELEASKELKSVALRTDLKRN